MQRVNLHAGPSIIQVGCPTCCYHVCALDHAKGGTADLDYPSVPYHRNDNAALQSEHRPCVHTLPGILGEKCLVIRTDNHFLNFIQAVQHLVPMALSQPPPEHSMSPRYLKVASTSSMGPSTSSSVSVLLSMDQALPIHLWQTVLVGHQSSSNATAPLVDPQLALWALKGVTANTTRVDSAGVLARFL